MLETHPPCAMDADHIPDGDVVVCLDAPEAQPRAVDDAVAPWAFSGALSMPGSEHLIPLLN